jgi:hypothetical protein
MQEMLPVGAFVRRRAVPVLDAYFPSPFLGGKQDETVVL